MPPVGFEPTISAGERAQIYASGRAVTGTGGIRDLRSWNLNPSTPNDHYSGRTAPLASKRCFLYIYSTNIDAEYFKHGTYSQFFFCSKCSLFHNSKVFGSCIIQILYTGVPKLKKYIFLAPKG